MTRNACGLECSRRPALARCGGRSNFCRLGSCDDCASDPLMSMETRQHVVEHFGGLGLGWHCPVTHPRLPDLPDHLATIDGSASGWSRSLGARVLLG